MFHQSQEKYKIQEFFRIGSNFSTQKLDLSDFSPIDKGYELCILYGSNGLQLVRWQSFTEFLSNSTKQNTFYSKNYENNSIFRYIVKMKSKNVNDQSQTRRTSTYRNSVEFRKIPDFNIFPRTSGTCSKPLQSFNWKPTSYLSQSEIPQSPQIRGSEESKG